MEKVNILHKDYTFNQRIYQLKFPINIDYMIPSNDSVRLLSQFVKKMDLSEGSKYLIIQHLQGLEAYILHLVLHTFLVKKVNFSIT